MGHELMFFSTWVGDPKQDADKPIDGYDVILLAQKPHNDSGISAAQSLPGSHELVTILDPRSSKVCESTHWAMKILTRQRGSSRKCGIYGDISLVVG